MQSFKDMRAYFPRGLKQLEDGYKFSLDPLLLASFIGEIKGEKIALELGTGCGVASFACALDNTSVKILAIEREIKVLELAEKNNQSLALTEQIEFKEADVRDFHCDLAGKYDFVFSNPPYRELGTGKESTGARKDARFEVHGDLEAFIKCAAKHLKTRGSFYLVYLPEKLSLVFALLKKYNLEPKKILFVHGTKDTCSKIVLIEAKKNSQMALAVLAPLILHHREEWTKKALCFCPYLCQS